MTPTLRDPRRAHRPARATTNDPATTIPTLTRLRQGWSLLLRETLRTLPPHRRDALLRCWLRRLSQHSCRTVETLPHAVTLHALHGEGLLLSARRVRLHQRRNRVTAAQVEAFAGHLLRTGVPLGLLVSTGGFTHAAERVALSYTHPQVRLVPGDRWAADLSRRGLYPLEVLRPFLRRLFLPARKETSAKERA